MRSTHLVFLPILLSLGGFACGDSDDSNGDGPMCGEFEACGGKLEGSWKLEESCIVVLKQPTFSSCEDATAELHARMSEGSITFEDDTFQWNYEIETEMILKLPESCQGEGGEKTECSSLGIQLENGAQLTCAAAEGENEGCKCGASFSSRLSQNGELAIRGNRVQLVGEELGYCVKGDTLTLRQSQGIKMSGSEATSIFEWTFQRN